MITAQQFISEQLSPAAGAPSGPVVIGAPVLPLAFVWRGRTYAVNGILRQWKETGPCTHGSGEIYLRKHCYELLMEDRSVWTLYFERKARSGNQAKQRWWLYTRAEAAPTP